MKGAPSQMGRAFRRVQALAEAQGLEPEAIHFAQAFESNGVPQTLCVCGADDKQLDELSLNVTRREETSDEE